MNKKLDRIEARLKNLVEEKLVEAITGRPPGESLVERLIFGLRANLKQGPDESMIAPDQYILHVNPENLQDWQSRQESLDQIALQLHNQGRREGFHFNRKPSISIFSDPNIPRNEYGINVHFSGKETRFPDTTAMPPSPITNSSHKLPEDAYLIVHGSQSFPLEKIIINIGRHSENDLVINDPHISRHHAQLRVINHQYVLFDVGSTGGLFINGKRITQGTLRSGDVIRLGTSNLIYVQESPPEGPTTALPLDNESKPQ